MNDGTFGVTGEADPLNRTSSTGLKTTISTIRADVLQWRNRDMDFRSLDTLRKSAVGPAPHRGPDAGPECQPDVDALEAICRDDEICAI
jgi:hypothetical protein